MTGMDKTHENISENVQRQSYVFGELFTISSTYEPGEPMMLPTAVGRKRDESVTLRLRDGEEYAICEIPEDAEPHDDKWEYLAVNLHLLARTFAMVGLECERFHVVFYTPRAYEQACELADSTNKQAILTACAYDGRASSLISSFNAARKTPFKCVYNKSFPANIPVVKGTFYDRHLTPNVTGSWQPDFAPDDDTIALRNEYLIAELIQETCKYLYESVEEREDVPLFYNKGAICREFAICNQKQILEGVYDIDATETDMPEERFDSSLQVIMLDQASKVPGWESDDVITWANGQKDSLDDIWGLFDALMDDKDDSGAGGAGGTVVAGASGTINIPIPTDASGFVSAPETMGLMNERLIEMIEKADEINMYELMRTARDGVPIKDLIA